MVWGQINIYNYQQKTPKTKPVNEHEKLTWGEGEEKDRGLLDKLE